MDWKASEVDESLAIYLELTSLDEEQIVEVSFVYLFLRAIFSSHARVSDKQFVQHTKSRRLIFCAFGSSLLRFFLLIYLYLCQGLQCSIHVYRPGHHCKLSSAPLVLNFGGALFKFLCDIILIY